MLLALQAPTDSTTSIVLHCTQQPRTPKHNEALTGHTYVICLIQSPLQFTQQLLLLLLVVDDLLLQLLCLLHAFHRLEAQPHQPGNA